MEFYYTCCKIIRKEKECTEENVLPMFTFCSDIQCQYVLCILNIENI